MASKSGVQQRGCKVPAKGMQDMRCTEPCIHSLPAVGQKLVGLKQMAVRCQVRSAQSSLRCCGCSFQSSGLRSGCVCGFLSIQWLLFTCKFRMSTDPKFFLFLLFRWWPFLTWA